MMNASDLNDILLLAQVRDPPSLTRKEFECVREFIRGVAWLRSRGGLGSNSPLPQDVVEEAEARAILKLWQVLHRKGLDPTGNVRAYVVRIVETAVSDCRVELTKRRRQLHAAAVAIPARQAVDPQGTPDVTTIQRILALLEKRTQRERDLFLLHFAFGVPYALLAEDHRLPEAEIRNDCRNALNFLRKQLGSEEPE